MTVSPIEVHLGDESAKKLWEAVAKLVNHLEPQRGWCLVGGLMVQLHAFEHAASPRPTSDIDLLGDARARPSVTEHLGQAIDELGGELVEPSSIDPKLGHRFEIDGQTIDVLGPEGLKASPRTLGKQVTVQIPGRHSDPPPLRAGRSLDRRQPTLSASAPVPPGRNPAQGKSAPRPQSPGGPARGPGPALKFRRRPECARRRAEPQRAEVVERSREAASARREGRTPRRAHCPPRPPGARAAHRQIDGSMPRTTT